MMVVTRAVYSATTGIDCFMSRQLKRSARTETRVLSPAKKRREDARALPKLSQNETGAFGELRTKCFRSAMRPRIAFMVCSKVALRCRSISCCTRCLYMDPCADGYPGGQRRTDCRRSRAWCCASAWLSSLGHARASRIARALRKRRGADQFFVRPFRGACFRGAHSRCGRVRDHRFICGDFEKKRCATEKKQW